MKIAFVIKEPFTNPFKDSSNYGSKGVSPVWLKAKGLAERGHNVWVLSPASPVHRHGLVDGIMHIGVSGGMQSGWKGNSSMPKTWPALAAEELLRLHQDHPIDIIDIPLDCSGICSYLALSSEMDHMPAIVQIGEEAPDRSQSCEGKLPLYRFDGDISFTPSNPVESHIAILRLENFFHGVLNRHFAAHLPAA
jgi:hypothetical protein